MKFYQMLGNPLVPNLTSFVEVTEQRVRHVTPIGHTEFDEPYENITAEFKPRAGLVVRNILLRKYGDVTISKGDRVLRTVEHLVDGAGLRDYIHRLNSKRKAAADETEIADRETKARMVPKGIVLSRNLLKFPPLDANLSEPLWRQHLKIHGQFGERCPIWHVGEGDWINRGDPICSYAVKSGAFAKHISIAICSPVSGLVLDCSSTDYGKPWGGILLPEGAMHAEHPSAIYGPLYDFCFANRSYLFEKVCGTVLSDDEVAEARAALGKAEWRIDDVFLRYYDYPQYLTSQKPELREAFEKLLVIHREEGHPNWRGLQVTPSTGSRMSDVQQSPRPAAEDRDSERDRNWDARFKSRLQEALTRYGLRDGFTKLELDAADRARRIATDPTEHEQCDADYALLKSIAR